MTSNSFDELDRLRNRRAELYHERIVSPNRREIDEEIRKVSQEIEDLEPKAIQREIVKRIAQRWHEQND